MNAGQIRLHLLAVFLSCIPVRLLRIQLVASSLERLPTHITFIFLIICPWICREKKTWLKLSLAEKGLSLCLPHKPVVKGSMVALGLFLHTYGRSTEQSRFCQRPDDSVLITTQFSSSAWFGCSRVQHKRQFFKSILVAGMLLQSFLGVCSEILWLRWKAARWMCFLRAKACTLSPLLEMRVQKRPQMFQKKAGYCFYRLTFFPV